MSTELFSLAMNEIGDRYIEEALTYQAAGKAGRGAKGLRYLATAALVATLSVATLLVVSAKTREMIFGWFKEQYETFTHYEFHDEEERSVSTSEIDEAAVPYSLSEIPPGYTELVNDFDLGMQLIIYQNEEGRNLIVSANTGLGSSGDVYVEAEGSTIQPVEVAGVTGELYIPDDPTKDTSLVWIKENMFFYISGYFTPEELVYYAERLQPAPAQEEKATHYQLGYIPEGYKFLTENHSPHDHTIIYSNEAGLTLSFCYIWDPDGAEAFVKNGQTQVTASIHGVEADLQLSNDLLKESSSIVWEEDGILFYLAAFLPQDKLIVLAESVEEVPQSEMEGKL